MTDVCSELKNLPDFRGLDGASAMDIEAAQAELGLAFAQDYKDYLQAYSIASANGHELTGLCNFARLNVIKVTLKERGLQPAADASWYVIEKIGVDGAVAWQDSKGQVFITTPLCPTVTRAADSLLEYLGQ